MTDTITRTLHLPAPLPLVWEAFTHPAFLSRWFPDAALFTDGAVGVLRWDAHGDFPARIDDVDPMRTFAFTWSRTHDPVRPGESTQVRATFHRTDDGTELTLAESGFDALTDEDTAAARQENEQGWDEELAEFSTLVRELVDGRPCSPHEPTLTVLGSARLPVPRERAWELLTTPEHIEQWWGHPAVFPTGLHAGAHGTFEWVGHGLMPIHVTRFDPDERLHFYWGELGDPTPGDDASLIEFTLAPDGDNTVVLLVENMSPPQTRETLDGQVGGWTIVLKALQDYAARKAGLLRDEPCSQPRRPAGRTMARARR